MRSLKAIQDAEGEFLDKVWYNRSLALVDRILAGETPMPDERIMDGAGLSRAKVEAKYGEEALGPYDDFEWGMINGKLSALRWIMGDEWDMLDT